MKLPKTRPSTTRRATSSELLEAHKHPARLRFIKLQPYRRGRGPTFYLSTWDCYRQNRPHHSALGYRLTDASGHTIFIGEDIGIPLGTELDSDEAVRIALGFLTLRPGDTDAEFFRDYTEEQLAFAETHGEHLQMYAEEEAPVALVDVNDGGRAEVQGTSQRRRRA